MDPTTKFQFIILIFALISFTLLSLFSFSVVCVYIREVTRGPGWTFVALRRGNGGVQRPYGRCGANARVLQTP